MIAPNMPGEIIHAGQIIEAGKAQKLGDTVLGVFRDYVLHPTTPYMESGSLNIEYSDGNDSFYDAQRRSNSIVLGKNDQAILDEGISQFSRILGDRGDSKKLMIDPDFFIGTAGEGDWHFDGGQELRLLVNLSRTSLGLLIANSWEETDYEDFLGDTRFRREGPQDKSRIEQIDYAVGEGVLIDNIREIKQRVPHAGIRVDGKIFLRLCAFMKEE